MKYYFGLQFKRFKRKLIAFGIDPNLAFFLLLCFFIVFSKLIFFKTIYAKWIYSGIGLFYAVTFSESSKTELLKSIFSKQQFYKIRLLENFIIITPFILYLVFEQEFLFAILLIPASILPVFFDFSLPNNKSTATPFKKRPYESIWGFRKYYPLFLISYFILYRSIEVENYNLSLFALILNFLIFMSFYSNLEKSFFVWIFDRKPTSFLNLKIKQALINISILTLPLLILIIGFYTEMLLYSIVIQLIGYLYVVAAVLAKYVVFPKEISLPKSILFGISIVVIPLLFFTIPYFYNESQKQLKSIL